MRGPFESHLRALMRVHVCATHGLQEKADLALRHALLLAAHDAPHEGIHAGSFR